LRADGSIHRRHAVRVVALLVSLSGALLLDAQSANDPLYPNQWHLRNTGQGGGTPGEDANVEPVWATRRGSTNEVIAIVDDGLQIAHEDLAPNVLPGSSHNYVNGTSDPTTTNPHGTSAAGVAAARGFNGIGVTGVAPTAGLVGFNFLAQATLSNEADALSRLPQTVDIYSNSWGPPDDGRLGALASLTESALANGVANGRSGRGSIYVWAAGNGAAEGDNSNYDGYANSRYAIAVSATTNTGQRSWYSEEGANILVNAPSNGGVGSLPHITTTDLTGGPGYSTTNYTSTFGGTSSACPLVAGVAALMLQANPSLGWRDVRAILARTAEKNDPGDPDWTVNGAGFHVNHKYGFGRVDASAAVTAAATWTNLGPDLGGMASTAPNLAIPDSPGIGVFGSPISSSVFLEEDVNIEFVDVFFSAADHGYWGDLQIELISPSGSVSVLARPHEILTTSDRYNNWRFGTVRHFGESSRGTWTLSVKDGFTGLAGTFQRWEIRVHGTAHKVPAQITSPAPGTMLTSTSQVFAWDAGVGATAYWLDVGTSQGGYDIFQGYVGTARSWPISGIPLTGRPVWVRLRSLIDGSYQVRDSQFATLPPTPSRIFTPTPGTALGGPSVFFHWSDGQGVQFYWVNVGSTQGGYEYYSNYVGASHSLNVTGLPTDGRPIWVRLMSYYDGEYHPIDHQFFAASPTPARITSPATGSVLPGSSAAFMWNSGIGVSFYWVNVGSTQGGYEYYSNYVGTSRSLTVTGLPVDGRAIWVRLMSYIDGQYFSVDHAFAAATAGPARIISPAAGAVLGGAAQTFTWNDGVGAQFYWVNVGSTQGGYEYYSNYVGTSRSLTVSGLPVDGRAIWVRLMSYINGAYQFVDHQFTAASPVPSRIITPLAGTTLTSSTQTFQWDNGVGVAFYWLDVGTAQGGYDVFSNYLGTDHARTISGLPISGGDIWVRLYSRIGNQWVFVDHRYPTQ
jgi:subtilisin-like proprotein convertase family protein